MRHARPLAVAAICGLTLVAAPADAATNIGSGGIDPSLTTISLLNTNDFHGHFSKDFACTVVTATKELPGATFLSAGDNVGGSPFSSAIQDDNPSIDFLNALHLQASSVGNHEFDKGYDDLTGRVQARADWTYLGANVYKKGTTTPALPSYKILTINGVKVGVIGAVTETTPTMVAAAGVSGLTFGDPVDAVNRVAAQLKDGNPANGEADVIVAEYHEGAPEGEDTTLAQAESQSAVFKKIVNQTAGSVDAIFTGHTHQLYDWDGPVPGGSGTRPVVQTDFYAQYLGALQLGYDPTTKKVTQYAYTNRPVAAPTAACAADASYVKAASVVDAANAYADKVGQQQIGTVTAPITTAYKADGSRDDRMRESTLSNAIAQSYVDSINAPGRPGGVQIGVMNPGGVRAELLGEDGGKVTYADAASIMPFNNTIVTKKLTGASLRKALEQQWQPATASRPYLALGLSKNVTYTYDPTAADGKHITSVTIDGKPLQDNETYTVASNSFLMAGGDNFTAFGEGTGTSDSGLIDQTLFIEWIKSHSPLSPSFAKHGVAVTGQPTQVAAGQSVSFAVSGVDFTSKGSPTTTSVTVSLGGTSLGSFPVTPGLSTAPPYPTRNGSADITVTVPSDAAAGAADLIVTSAQTGTTVTIPVTVTSSSTPTGTPTGTATGTATPTDTATSTSTGTSTATSTDSSSSSVTGPPVITDGAADGGNSAVLLTGSALMLTLLAGVWVAVRRARG